LLEADIDAGLHAQKSREELWESRDEHLLCFPFDVFMKHLHQAVRSSKFVKHRQDTRAKTLSKAKI